MSKATKKSGPGQLKFPVQPEDTHRLVQEVLRGKLRLGVMEVIYQLFEEEKQELVGPRWSRKGEDQARSGGSEKGHIYLEGRRVPVRYPRVRDKNGSRAVDAYQALGSFDLMAEEVLSKLVRGVSTRDYAGVVSQVVEGTGLKKSTVSKAFIKASRKSLDEINGRDLSKHLFVGLFFDGIGFGETTVVAGLGVSAKGEKVLLGLVEGTTENAQVVSDLLDNLESRGLRLTEKFLATLDGHKALRKAVVSRWKERAIIHRCQQHKKRNVASYLSKPHQREARRRMTAAYTSKNYTDAKAILDNTVRWLQQINESAANSLREGLEETLTVVRLGLPEILRKTFSTTNPIESVFDGVRTRTGRVKRWRRGKESMVMRWAAATGLEGEKRMNRIRGHKLIPLLIDALKKFEVDEIRRTG